VDSDVAMRTFKRVNTREQTKALRERHSELMQKFIQLWNKECEEVENHTRFQQKVSRKLATG
jgi:hypothetical protein